MTPWCPRCGVRRQARTRSGRLRGTCSPCWAEARRSPHAEGEERDGLRGPEVYHDGRWQPAARVAAEAAGALTPGARARIRDGHLEVAVWQTVDTPVGPASDGPVLDGGTGSPPSRSRRRAPRSLRTQVNMDAELYGEARALADAEGMTVAEWLRALAMLEVKG